MIASKIIAANTRSARSFVLVCLIDLKRRSTLTWTRPHLYPTNSENTNSPLPQSAITFPVQPTQTSLRDHFPPRPHSNETKMNYSSCVSLVLLALTTPQLQAFSGFSSSRSSPHRTPFVSSGRRSSQPLLMSLTDTGNAFELPDEVPDDNKNKNRGLSSQEDMPMSLARHTRLAQERESADRFVTGDDLYELRNQVMELRLELSEARIVNDVVLALELERTILQAQQVDAEFIYTVAMERMEAAQQAGLKEEAAVYRAEADMAKNALPQFQLDGLWVGKYGQQGFEMINVTYTGDTLVAYKVTGDQNVPKGEVSFTVDLNPTAGLTGDADILEPIELASDAAGQWGSRFLQRFSGQGQVASEGFANSQWLDGQLILVGDYFSFAWLPIGHQVFFGRPSPELTLKLLAKAQEAGVEDPTANVRQHLARCLEETELLDDEMEVNDGLFHSHDQHDYYQREGCFE